MTLTIIMVTLQNDIAIVLLYPPLKRSFLLPIKLLLCVPVSIERVHTCTYLLNNYYNKINDKLHNLLVLWVYNNN